MAAPIRILVVGLGQMGLSHARAYAADPAFRIVGLCARGVMGLDLPAELALVPRFADYHVALTSLRPDAVSINTLPDTHAAFAVAALEQGAHVFAEKPIATNLPDAERVVSMARARGRKLMLGYILRVHPSWQQFISIGRTLGKPLVMRLNLNQQSSGAALDGHRRLLDSLTPIVDCGVHYVDVMCQLTGARPVRVHGIGAALWPGAPRQNYGHLHVTFDDGSVGWYEAGWGPMMSETAYFVKDVVGPRGAVSMVPDDRARAGTGLSDSADIDRHTKTDAIRVHWADLGANGQFSRPDDVLSMQDEPGHQDLCDRQAAAFRDAILCNHDLSSSMQAAVDSLRIVLAAQTSIDEGRVIHLD